MAQQGQAQGLGARPGAPAAPFALGGMAGAGLVALQLGIIAGLVFEFQLESPALGLILLLAIPGFLLAQLLPERWELPWFVALSVASVFLVLHAAGLWVLGLAGGLILLCHLPIGFRARLFLVLGAALVLAMLRVDWVPNPVPALAWPLLSSMFMFRLASYLYALKHADAPPAGGWATLAYFLMLPNPAFSLFPLVDYKTFVRSREGTLPAEVHARGLRWMLRGVLHLLLYRVVYHFLTIDPVSVATLGDVVQLTCVSWLLYLRVSGQFHLIVGLLHLFGFRLPETNHRYFLASSFTDLWRRTNIYWKEYMQKLVYFPSFFYLRRFGRTRGMILGTAVVMVATWLLHGYQTFWVWGRSSFSETDLAFWGVLGALVVCSAAYEVYRPARGGAGRPGWSLRRGAATAAVFLTMGVLFTLWESESVAFFLETMARARHVDLRGVLLLGGVVAVAVVLGGSPWGADRRAETVPQPGPPAHRQELLRLAVLGLLAVAGSGRVQQRLGANLREVATRLGSNAENSIDLLAEVHGYYDDLGRNEELTGLTWHGEARPASDREGLATSGAYRKRNDLELAELRPNVSTSVKGALFTTNSRGLHDYEYALEKPPGVMRIALLGPSIAMGPGVRMEANFENLLEQRLNREFGDSTRRYEILNFGVSAFSVVQMVAQLDRMVMPYRPDIVLFCTTPPEGHWVARELQVAVNRGIPLPPALEAALIRDRERPISASTVRRRLIPILDSLFDATLAQADRRIREADAVPVMLVFRLPGFPRLADRTLQDAAARRRWMLIDLTELYGGRDETPYRMGWYDMHFNAAGHRLVADRLFGELVARAEVLRLPLPHPVDGPLAGR